METMAQLAISDSSKFHFKSMDIHNKYDQILGIELEKRLKRKPSSSELVNGDYDSDLVNECFWQLIVDLDKRTKENSDKVEKMVK